MNGLPQVTRRHGSGHELELEFTLGADNPWFAGHFPGQPILPGVVQIGWAAHFAVALRDDDTPPMTLQRVKFRYPVGPGAHLLLRLEHAGDRVRFQYRLLADAEPIDVSSGVLCYVGAA